MTWAEVAEAAFRRSETWLRENIGEGSLKTFPRPDPLLNLFSRKQVEGWIDRRFGITSIFADPEAAALEAAKGGARHSGARTKQSLKSLQNK